jgi:RHS repeat-associated protein
LRTPARNAGDLRLEQAIEPDSSRRAGGQPDDGGQWITDRLGSARATGAGPTMSYLPYGEELTSTADGQYKFGTYVRDSTLNNQDYADQRYYHAALGRFYSPDPAGLAAVNPTNPITWNRYAYVGGDPVNFSDPSGLFGRRDPCLVNPDSCEDFGIGGGAGDFGGGSDIMHPINDDQGHQPNAKADQRWERAVEKLSNGNNLLQNLVPSGPCAGDFAALQAAYGIGLTDVQNQGNISNWVDATRSTDLESSLFTPGTAAYNFWVTQNPTFTVADYFLANNAPNRSVGAQTAFTISASSGNIYFRPQYVNGLSDGQAAALLAHELLHSLGIDDDMAQMALFGSTSLNTSNITNKFYQDCFR